MSSKQSFQIKVTAVRNRKPKSIQKPETSILSGLIIKVLQSDELYKLKDPELFVSVVAGALSDISEHH